MELPTMTDTNSTQERTEGLHAAEPVMIEDLGNWAEGIGVAMINLVDDAQLTALA
jgi:hypothetical protein